jgi:hypothetical protein
VVTGTVVAGAVAALLLAWPAWFALAGPAHLAGPIWPGQDLATEGTTLHAVLWPTPASATFARFTRWIGGPQGPALSYQYLGWGLVAVAVGGLVAFRRDRRLWWLGAMASVSALLSLGNGPGRWAPWAVLGRLPVLRYVVPSRFELVTSLCLAVMLGLVVDQVRTALGARPALPRVVAAGAAAAVAAVAVVPLAVYLAPDVPMAVRTVRAPTWFSAVGTRLPSRNVLLVFPVPYQAVESAMAWQAVTGYPYAMVGAGGPSGVPARAGPERAGAVAVGRASFAFAPQRLRPGEVPATRRALVAWGVDRIVLSDQPGLPSYDRVSSVPYTVAFVTAVTGRVPVRRGGAWVWSDASRSLPAGPGPTPAGLAACVARGGGGSPTEIRQVARCAEAAV